jgi:hypothetical protein
MDDSGHCWELARGPRLVHEYVAHEPREWEHPDLQQSQAC